MKAIVQNNYGSPDILEIKEVPRPEFDENQVLIRVHATGLNAGDVFMLKGSPWLARFSVGFPKPKDHILGWDVAGRVEEVGKGVTRFKSGDEVFALCGGGLAEYVRTGEKNVAMKPANLTHVQAAAVPTGGLTALQGLRNVGNVQPDQKVLITGASGGVGTFAVQIAKMLGAEVTGVCSTKKVDLVQSIGADHVIDYSKEDFTKTGKRYDLILDNVANRSFSDLRRALAPDGMIIPNSGHGGMSYVIKAYLLKPFLRQIGSMYLATSNENDMATLKELLETGKITPVIDRTYPFSETSEALRYLEEGNARGKVVINVMDDHHS